MRPLLVGFASLAAVVFVNCLATPLMADWDPGDGYKMRTPQLPDPEGWDIRINNARRQPGEPFQWLCADDWLCTATGPVTDVHLWVSWMEDRSDKIVNLHLSIHDDVPAGADPDPAVTWSHPGAIRWERDFGPDEFRIRDYGTGDQGWYDPPFDEWQRPDHQGFQQINVINIPRPFTQEEGTIYWLDVSVDLWGESEIAKLGWKTSLNHFGDDAVYWNMAMQQWSELRDPILPERSLDLAFVITPEPSTLVLLGVGTLALLAYAWRKARPR